jgi:alpha-galactosidase
MLEVGNGGMSMTEYESHFSLWALLKAPLLIGNDVTNIKPEVLHLLGNLDIIAVNQDKLGKQGRRVKRSFWGHEVWAGELSGGSVAVVMFNRGWFSSTIEFNFKEVGFSQEVAEVYDLLAQSVVNEAKGSFSSSVKSGGVRFVRLDPPKPQRG